MKIKISKKEKSFKKKNLHLSPNIFWKLAIFIVLAVIVFSSFFGYRLFMQVNKEFILETDTNDTQIKTIKKERISKVLEYFSSREEKSKQISNSPALIIDPSL